MSTRQTSTGTAQFPNMLKVARDLGCQIQPSAGNPNMLNGLCPFHESRTLHEAKTLYVDLQTARFQCTACDSSGNPMAFIAKVWGMSAQETYEFISGGAEITAQRPMRERNGRSNEDGPPPAQNTAVLTMAARYYRTQVEQNFTPLSYLARLGIEPGRAAEAGFGYCSGEGLREYLERQKATPEEIDDSPLFQEITGMEILSGCPVLFDMDFTGAAIWMMGLVPEERDPGAGWLPGRPRTRGIRGRRNNLFNMRDMSQRSGSVVLTDDPRLHLVLIAGGVPSSMTTRARRGDRPESMTGRIAGTLAQRNVNRVVLAMHDVDVARKIQQETAEAKPNTRMEIRGADVIMRQLNHWERDLAGFTAFAPAKATPAPVGTAKAAPVETAPVETAPVPVKTAQAPVETAPVETAPVETAPAPVETAQAPDPVRTGPGPTGADPSPAAAAPGPAGASPGDCGNAEDRQPEKEPWPEAIVRGGETHPGQHQPGDSGTGGT